MEPKFIELHTRGLNSGAGCQVSVNVAAIKCFHMNLDERIPSETGVIETADDCMYLVTESYTEIKQLIHDSGILIHRADPRLNTERELTFAELREMIGEPVWNSNLLRWELVKKADDLYITTCSIGQYDSHYDENDLIKTPLYRMRRDDGKA